MNRFFVDERVGCIAVRDKFRTDPEYRGLHRDTEGVVAYRFGYQKNNQWEIFESDRLDMVFLAEQLNNISQYSECSPCGAD